MKKALYLIRLYSARFFRAVGKHSILAPTGLYILILSFTILTCISMDLGFRLDSTKYRINADKEIKISLEEVRLEKINNIVITMCDDKSLYDRVECMKQVKEEMIKVLK
jgi:hypothetical protein